MQLFKIMMGDDDGSYLYLVFCRMISEAIFLQLSYPRPDGVVCVWGALAVGFTFVDQVLPDEPDPEALCVVCFECAVCCETAEIGECKLVDDDDDDVDDRLCVSP